MIDCHTHILPNVDDGCKNITDSLAVVNKFKSRGITTVFATPHFYPDDTVESFLLRRQEAYECLMEAIKEEQIEQMDIRMGAEVLLSVDTPSLEGLEKLCIQGTRYILIELPYVDWSEWVYEALYKIIAHRQLIPVIAHMERYESVISTLEKYNKLLKLDIVVQMNAYSLHGKNRRLAMKLIKKNMIHVLGSDTHHPKASVSVARGHELISKKLKKGYSEKLMENARCLLANETIEKQEFRPIRKKFGFFI